ncbi:hypothetical protein COT83_01955, partial [Candidatus Peregrinibacteria bacterium CG10_big_fil_rev_8_21_14_0_10_44_7]
ENKYRGVVLVVKYSIVAKEVVSVGSIKISDKEGRLIFFWKFLINGEKNLLIRASRAGLTKNISPRVYSNGNSNIKKGFFCRI